jgi:signal transduction histidine kinase
MREVLDQITQTKRDLMALLFFGTVALVLFMFFVPLDIFASVEPFKSIKNWYLIINVFMIGFGLAMGAGLIYQINSNFFEIYSDQMLDLWAVNIDMPSGQVITAMMSLALLMIYFLVSLTIFGLKYIIRNISTYFVEHTFIGTLLSYSKKKTSSYLSDLFHEQYAKSLAKMFALHFLIFVLFTIIIYMLIGGEASLFVLIDLFFIAFYLFYLLSLLRKKAGEMKSHYDVLVDQAKDLSSGHFSEVKEDLGAFNSLRDEMNHVKEGFEAAVKEEVKSTTMKTELISNVSHDLKTPLTCIKNYVILLKDAKTKEDMQEYTTQIENYTNRLSTLIEDLFEVSKVNSGNVTLHTTSLDLLELLEQALVENEEKLEAKDLTVIRSSDLESAMVNLDGEKTYRVLDNLLSNIGKYALPHTRVYIDVTHDGDHVSIALKNISEAQMNFTSEEIVERFVRGDKSRHVSGSGLGLAIAKSFTEVMGGHFDLTIDGDMFKVTLTFALEKENNAEE